MLGALHRLARLPKGLGRYLALTGRSVGPADALAADPQAARRLVEEDRLPEEGALVDVAGSLSVVAEEEPKLRLQAVEQLVQGKPRNEATAMIAGNLAVDNAAPLRFNAYKIPLMRNLVKRAIRGVEA